MCNSVFTKFKKKMLSSENLSFDTEFINNWESIQSAETDQIKDLAIELSVKPSVANFWILSKFIRISSRQTISPIVSLLTDVLSKNCNLYLGASFATAHFINKFVETETEVCKQLLSDFKLPNNPQYASAIINLIANDNIIVERFDNFLGFPDLNVQKALAASIARTCKDPEALLLSKLEDIPNETNYNKRRGLILLCHSLIDNEIPIHFYIDSLMPILDEIGTCSSHLSCIYEAQLLLADLLFNNPSTFHQINFVDVTVKQFEADNLAPEFLRALLFAFGYKLLDVFAQPILATALTDPVSKYRPIIDAFIPYITFLDEKALNTFFEKMVMICNESRFDFNFLEMTARAFASVAPLVPSPFGTYMAIIEKNPKAAHFYGILRPVLEPRCPPPPQKVSTTTFVLEEDKREIATQAIPQRCDGFAQTEEDEKKTTIMTSTE